MKALKILENIDQVKPGMKQAIFGDIEIGWELDGRLIFDSEEVTLREHWEILYEVLTHIIENQEFRSGVDVHIFLMQVVELNLPEVITIDLVKKINKCSGLPMYSLRKSLADIRREA